MRLRFGMERQTLQRKCERMRGGPVQERRDMLGRWLRMRMQRRLDRHKTALKWCWPCDVGGVGQLQSCRLDPGGDALQRALNCGVGRFVSQLEPLPNFSELWAAAEYRPAMAATWPRSLVASVQTSGSPLSWCAPAVQRPCNWALDCLTPASGASGLQHLQWTTSLQSIHSF